MREPASSRAARMRSIMSVASRCPAGSTAADRRSQNPKPRTQNGCAKHRVEGAGSGPAQNPKPKTQKITIWVLRLVIWAFTPVRGPSETTLRIQNPRTQNLSESKWILGGAIHGESRYENRAVCRALSADRRAATPTPLRTRLRSVVSRGGDACEPRPIAVCVSCEIGMGDISRSSRLFPAPFSVLRLRRHVACRRHRLPLLGAARSHSSTSLGQHPNA